jgi:hypothetical protein
MDSGDGILYGLIAGCVLSFIVTFPLMRLDTAENHYFQNVCKWERGVVKDDLCIKDNIVIGKKRGYQFVDFKEVP